MDYSGMHQQLGQNGYQGYNMEGAEMQHQQPTSPIGQNGNDGTENGGAEKYTDIKNILDQILNMNDLNLDDARKSTIHSHRMKPALFSVLCEIKESI